MKKFLETLHQLERIDLLIRRKATGTPVVLANRLGVSERTVYNLIEGLRVLGAKVSFCRSTGSYYYENNFCFRVIEKEVEYL